MYYISQLHVILELSQNSKFNLKLVISANVFQCHLHPLPIASLGPFARVRAALNRIQSTNKKTSPGKGPTQDLDAGLEIFDRGIQWAQSVVWIKYGVTGCMWSRPLDPTEFSAYEEGLGAWPRPPNKPSVSIRLVRKASVAHSLPLTPPPQWPLPPLSVVGRVLRGPL